MKTKRQSNLVVVHDYVFMRCDWYFIHFLYSLSSADSSIKVGADFLSICTAENLIRCILFSVYGSGVSRNEDK